MAFSDPNLSTQIEQIYLQAIKRYREMTNCDLKTAKRVIDSL
jgi:ribosomal protein L7/L12